MLNNITSKKAQEEGTSFMTLDPKKKVTIQIFWL